MNPAHKDELDEKPSAIVDVTWSTLIRSREGRTKEIEQIYLFEWISNFLRNFSRNSSPFFFFYSSIPSFWKDKIDKKKKKKKEKDSKKRLKPKAICHNLDPIFIKEDIYY